MRKGVGTWHRVFSDGLHTKCRRVITTQWSAITHLAAGEKPKGMKCSRCESAISDTMVGALGSTRKGIDYRPSERFNT